MSEPRNEAAERLRQQHGHRMVQRPGPVASDYLYEVVDEALATERRDTVERIENETGKPAATMRCDCVVIKRPHALVDHWVPEL